MPRILKIKRQVAPESHQKHHDKFYDSPPWRRLRRHKLTIQPYCEYCQDKGFIVNARFADHYLPRRLWPELELSLDNLRSCCDKCHQRKRQIEGRYNNRSILTIKLNEHGFTDGYSKGMERV